MFVLVLTKQNKRPIIVLVNTQKTINHTNGVGAPLIDRSFT